MINYEKIKEDFPVLNKEIRGKKPIYFDSACMSLKPIQVVKAINEYYLEYPACAGRSSHYLAGIVTKKVKEVRELVAKFINADSREIIFLRNTTEAINLIANSFNFENGDIVLTTDKEHNSNLIPWQTLSRKKGIEHRIFRTNDDGSFDFKTFAEEVKNVKLVSILHTSNFDGTTLPVKEIIKIAHENGALVLLDAAQSAPHINIDVKDLDIDFLAFSGHKLLGPTGTGVLYGKIKELEKLNPFLVGGNTVEFSTYAEHKLMPVPERFEAGLQDYAGIIGLGCAIEYLMSIGFEGIRNHELELNKYISQELEKLPNVNIIGPKNPEHRSGIISFYINGVDMHQIGSMLEEMSGIMIRVGQHCAHSWYNDRNVTNSARVSLYFYNTMDEAKLFVESLNKIIKIL